MLFWAKRTWKTASVTRLLHFPLPSWSQEIKVPHGRCPPCTRRGDILFWPLLGMEAEKSVQTDLARVSLIFPLVPVCFSHFSSRVCLCSTWCMGKEALRLLWVFIFSVGVSQTWTNSCAFPLLVCLLSLKALKMFIWTLKSLSFLTLCNIMYNFNKTKCPLWKFLISNRAVTESFYPFFSFNLLSVKLLDSFQDLKQNYWFGCNGS